MKLSELQAKIKVSKNELNKFGGYKYRTAEQILTEAKRIINGQALILLTEEVVPLGNRYYVKATAKFIGSDTHEVNSYAREADEKKGSEASQITGSATSYARKYALGGLLMIDDGDDPDAENQEKPVEKKKETPKPSEKKEPVNSKFIDAMEGLYKELKELGKEIVWSDIMRVHKLSAGHDAYQSISQRDKQKEIYETAKKYLDKERADFISSIKKLLSNPASDKPYNELNPEAKKLEDIDSKTLFKILMALK